MCKFDGGGNSGEEFGQAEANSVPRGISATLALTEIVRLTLLTEPQFDESGIVASVVLTCGYV